MCTHIYLLHDHCCVNVLVTCKIFTVGLGHEIILTVKFWQTYEYHYQVSEDLNKVQNK